MTVHTTVTLPDIPALNELRTRKQWVAWYYGEKKDGTPTKLPVNPARWCARKRCRLQHMGVV